MGNYSIEEFVTMEYYNIEQIVRIEVWKTIKAYSWRIKPLKSIGFIDSLFDRSLWKLNQKYPLYLNTTTYEGWFTPLDIKEHLSPEYYFDEETLQVKEYPTVRLYLVDGTKTIMHFKNYQSALDYAEKLVSKSEHLIQLDKI